MGNLGISLIDFILPRFCPACQTRLPDSSVFICNDCLSDIKNADYDRLKSEYDRKFAESDIISDFTCRFVFEKDKKLQHVIHSLKYEKRFLLGIYLGELLGQAIKKDFTRYNIDMMIPVPLHHLKKAEREYNQSFYIAKGIKKTTGIRIYNRQIRRKRFTESQTSRNLFRREENMRGAFGCVKKLSGENVLLVDDVITTGATIRECGRVLRDAGAGRIYAASVAIAD